MIVLKQTKMLFYENPVSYFANYLNLQTKGGTILPINDESMELELEFDIEEKY